MIIVKTLFSEYAKTQLVKQQDCISFKHSRQEKKKLKFTMRTSYCIASLTTLSTQSSTNVVLKLEIVRLRQSLLWKLANQRCCARMTRHSM